MSSSDKPAPPVRLVPKAPASGTHPNVSFSQETLMKALREAQQRAEENERRARSYELQLSEVQAISEERYRHVQQLLDANIDGAAKRLITRLRKENANLRDRCEIAEDEASRSKSEHEKLLLHYEAETDSARSIIEMLNEELAKADAEAIDARELSIRVKIEIAELKSAISVRETLMSELKELKYELEQTDKLMLTDLSVKGYSSVMSKLSELSLQWLQSDDSRQHADGFRLQTTILQQWRDKRGY